MIGLNLRMTEPTAAIAYTQLKRADSIINSRIELAEEITDMFSGVPWIETPRADVGCRHVYYLWAAKVTNGNRRTLVSSLSSRGFPMRVGYSPLLDTIFDGSGECPEAKRMEYEELITFEICAYSPKKEHLKKMCEIAKRAIDENSK